MVVGLITAAVLAQGPRPEAVCIDLLGKHVVPLQRTQPAAKATVLIFYIAHCPISQKLTPEINRLYREFTPKGVRFFLVHEDLTLDATEVAKGAKAFGLLPKIVIDKWKTQMALSGASISPETAVYDSAQRLKYRGRINDLFFALGKMRPKATKHDLREAILGVLAGSKAPFRQTKAIGCILPKVT